MRFLAYLTLQQMFPSSGQVAIWAALIRFLRGMLAENGIIKPVSGSLLSLQDSDATHLKYHT